MDSDNTLPLEAAPHNCIPCKKNKRRCDKKIPSCSLCIRMRRVCDYPEALEPINQEEVARLQSRIVDLEALVSRLSGYNAQNSSVLIHGGERPISNNSPNPSSEYLLQTFFLDSDILKSGKFSAPTVNVLVSDEIQEVLGDRSAIAYTTSRYFQCINPWMPIISKIKLNRLIETPTIELAADLALLLLGMMLLLELPVDKRPSQSTIYNLARQFRFALDMAGLHSLMTLQAGLLISVYELGHAILPAAYLSIANCAREGIALGIHHRDAPQMLHRPSNWISWEERQRVWWLVLILDRFVTVGSDDRPLCTDDPGNDMLIPADDEAWERGEMVPPEHVHVSAPPSVTVSPFARLSQACNLLGRVIRHCNDANLEPKYALDDMMLLYNTTASLLDLLPVDDISGAYLNPAAVCYSAIMKLGENHSCDSHTTNSRPIDLEAVSLARECVERSLQILKDISVKITTFAERVQRHLSLSGAEKISPLVLHCIYRAAITMSWLSSETGDEKYRIRKNICEKLLQTIDIRWKTAGVYLEILAIADNELSRSRQ